MGLVVTSLAIYGLILGYIRFTEPASEVFTLALRSDAPAEGKKHFEIVGRYADTLSRNAGRIVVPESQLPHPREEIKRAILAKPPWAQNFQSHGGILYFSAALVELQNFVPDHGAKDMTHEQIWNRQLEVIKGLGRYRSAGWQEKPITIGEVKKSLDEMSSLRDEQLMGYLALFVLLGCAMFKTNIRFSSTLLRSWQFWLFLVAVFSFYPLGKFTALFGQWLEFTARRDAIFETAMWLTFALGIFIPLLVVSVLWDLLLRPAMKRRERVAPGRTP